MVTISKLFIFIGDVSDVEDSDRASTPQSPRIIGVVVPAGVVKPIAVKVSSRRRMAVESINDLLAEPEQTEPLDLSLKRPKLS